MSAPGRQPSRDIIKDVNQRVAAIAARSTGGMDAATLRQLIREELGHALLAQTSDGAAAAPASATAATVVVSRDIPENLAAAFISKNGVCAPLRLCVFLYSCAWLFLLSVVVYFASFIQGKMRLRSCASYTASTRRIWRILPAWTRKFKQPCATRGRTLPALSAPRWCKRCPTSALMTDLSRFVVFVFQLRVHDAAVQ